MKTGKHSLALCCAAAGLAAAALVPAGLARGAQGTKPMRLFNGRNFDGWYIFIRGDEKPTPGAGKTEDSKGVFKIEPGGIIHVSGEKFGYLGTDKEYDNFRFGVEFKWGEKKWPPRDTAKRDAGILYNAVGMDKVWMESLECQIQEGDVGDMWLTAGAGGKPALTVKGKRYEGGRVEKFADFEKPNGEWNQVEVVVRGGTVQHYVNGKLNFEGTDASLTRGRIDLQSEGAELYYRNVTLEPLSPGK